MASIIVEIPQTWDIAKARKTAKKLETGKQYGIAVEYGDGLTAHKGQAKVSADTLIQILAAISKALMSG